MALQKPPLERAFMLVEPGPILFITTNDGRENNIMTIAWRTILDFTPQIALTAGLWSHSFQALRDVEEYVLTIPAVDLAEKMVAVGDHSDAVVNEFRKFGLTPFPGLRGEALLVSECLAYLECRVLDYTEPYDIFIPQGTQAWMDLERRGCRIPCTNGDGASRVDGEILRLRSLMKDKLPPGVQRTATFLGS